MYFSVICTSSCSNSFFTAYVRVFCLYACLCTIYVTSTWRGHKVYQIHASVFIELLVVFLFNFFSSLHILHIYSLSDAHLVDNKTLLHEIAYMTHWTCRDEAAPHLEPHLHWLASMVWEGATKLLQEISHLQFDTAVDRVYTIITSWQHGSTGPVRTSDTGWTTTR